MFVLSLVLGSLKVISIDPNFVGYAMIALAVLSTIVSPKEVLTSLDANMIIFCAGINLMIAVMNQSGLGNLFGEIIISLIGESRNLYVITAIVCIGASIATQFMNNMACAGMLAPVGISIAEALGANPQAIVLAIAIGAGCSYQPDHDALHQAEIPGLHQIWLAPAHHFLDLLRADSASGIPVLLKDRKGDSYHENRTQTMSARRPGRAGRVYHQFSERL